jgi:Acetyltransferase (GNAT) domain
VKAELIADRGEAASSAEFFRSRPFLDAEDVTHTLRIEADAEVLLAPLIVRRIGDRTERDASSPYGYPGFAAPGAARIDPANLDLSGAGIISAFIRHRLGEPPLAGAVERKLVQIADPSLPRKSRMSDRQQIRRNLRRGYEPRIVAGAETTAAERRAFGAAYEQTMRRTGAARRYFFGTPYFDRILQAPGTWLALAHAPGGEVAAASIADASDGVLHYYLSATADSHLRDSPMKNVLERLVDLATELGLPLNLGGGISRGDLLEEFKRGFANREAPWCTSELICDPATYARLAEGHDGAAGFFPAYRAPLDAMPAS